MAGMAGAFGLRQLGQRGLPANVELAHACIGELQAIQVCDSP
jgi:hypothetical protein